MDIEFALPQLEEAIGAFTGSVNKLERALAKALYLEAQEIMADSKANYCPVGVPPEDKAPGTLRNSGFVDKPEVTNGLIVVRLGYGGAAEEYAIVQHEELSYHHTTGQAKFLETPMLNAQGHVDARLSAMIAEDDVDVKRGAA